MLEKELRFRQIHMDFHTSPDIPDVGAEFDADEFADTLAAAHVNSCTCFARCHHGHIYYATQSYPELVHPTLMVPNLLEQQVSALHKRDIRCPVYTTIQWDDLMFHQHPEWRAVSMDGSVIGTNPLDAGFYAFLCINSPYRDFLKDHVTDLCTCVPDIDGIFYDIVWPQPCVCRHCVQKMKGMGLDPRTKEDVHKAARATIVDFITDISAYTRNINPQLSIYYNSGAIGPDFHDHVAAYSHLEFDVLPSQSPNGYDVFPARGRFERNIKDCVGQTGKFFGGWGDFHTLKPQKALSMETSQLLALNCKVMTGDQLPPSGRIDPHTYEVIGEAYARIKAKEPWCKGARAATDIGLLVRHTHGPYLAAARILERGGHQFDLIDSTMDFTKYELLVVPDEITLNDTLLAKLQAYLHQGGKLIASFESGMNPQKTAFVLPELGIELLGPGPLAWKDGQPARGRFINRNGYSDFVRPQGAMANGLRDMDYSMYCKGMDVKAAAGAESLCDQIAPYFFRTPEHFCSHRSVPSSGEKSGDAVVRNGNVIYFAHPVFNIFAVEGAPWAMQLVWNALDLLLDTPLLRKSGPENLVVTVNHQAELNRDVLHLLYYNMENVCRSRQLLADVVPIHDVGLDLRVELAPRCVTLVPSGETLDFTVEDGRLLFTVPEMSGHQMVEVQYA